jgi:hypothetical protein
MFPGEGVEDILEGDDTFFTKHLLANLQKAKFTELYNKLKHPPKK